MEYLSSRLDPVKPSASAAVSQAARAARARGEDVIDLGLGEPDFDTPEHIIEAAYRAAKEGQTRYPPTEGTLALKTAVAAKFLRDNDLDYNLSQVMVCNGAKQVIFNALMASLEPDDEVLLCAPYFGQYKDMALILGATPKVIPCSASDGFKLTTEALEASINDKTRWLFLNLPSNPVGAIFTRLDLEALGAVLERHPNVLILSDEIYEHILFDDREFLSFAATCPRLKDRILTVNGVSKAYAMTGWRVGYCAGPQPLIEAMTKVQSQISSGVCAIAQAAAVAALEGPQDDVVKFRNAFESRRDLIVGRIAMIDGLNLDPPGGAFYAYIGCEAFIGASTPDGTIIKDDIGFTQYLLSAGGIASVPGSAYDLSPFFRISTATSEDVLTDAMDRLAQCTANLGRN
jgi:aspartate aminotransferase